MTRETLDAFVNLACACGSVHTVSRDRAVALAGLRRFQCRPCGGRFVVAHVPEFDGQPEAILPVFLEETAAADESEQLGVPREQWDEYEVPPDLRFQCRCGSRLVVKSKSYGDSRKCPRCGTRILLRLGHDGESGAPIPLAEYLGA